MASRQRLFYATLCRATWAESATTTAQPSHHAATCGTLSQWPTLALNGRGSLVSPLSLTVEQKLHPPSTLQLVTTRRLRTAPSRRATAAKPAAVRSLGLVLVDDFAPHRHDPLVRPANLEHSGVVVVEILRRRAEALEAGLLRPAEETAQGGGEATGLVELLTSGAQFRRRFRACGAVGRCSDELSRTRRCARCASGRSGRAGSLRR